MRGFLAIVVAVLPLAACNSGNGSADGSVVDTPASAQSSTAEGSSWNFSEVVDPMTDVKTSAATTTMADSNYVAEIFVACVGSAENSSLRYTINFFDKSGIAESIRSASPMTGDTVGYNVRLDSSPMERHVVRVGFSNQIVFTPTRVTTNSDYNKQSEEEVIASNIVRISAPLSTGDMLITIDQRDAAVQRVFDRCRNSIASRSQEVREWAANRSAQEAARAESQARLSAEAQAGRETEVRNVDPAPPKKE